MIRIIKNFKLYLYFLDIILKTKKTQNKTVLNFKLVGNLE